MKNLVKKLMVIVVCVLISQTAITQNKYASVNFSTGKAVTDGISGINMSGNLEDRYDDSYHLKLLRGEYLDLSFNIPMNSPSGKIELKHLTSGAGGSDGYSPVTLYVNNNQVTSWKNLGQGYTTDAVDISKFLTRGTNTIRLKYSDADGSSGYWIKFVHIYTW